MLTLLPPLLWKPTILDLEKKSKDVLRQQSEGAEGDGAAHQLDLQVFFFWHPSIGEVDQSFLPSRYLQNRTRVSVWLYENVNTRIEGHITGISIFREKITNAITNYIGFDEYMNLVLDDACEVHLKRKTEKVLFLL